MRNLTQFCKKSDLAAEYKRKCVTADEAVKVIKSGHKVHVGGFGGVVKDLEAALAKRVDELTDVILCSTLWSHKDASYETIKADPDGTHFRIHSTHMSKADRVVNKQGHEWFIPILFREGNKNWSENGNLDVAFIMVAPMDAQGNFNLSITVAETIGIVENADIIILEVNENLPVCHGLENYINISEADFIVESTNYPIPELPARDPGEEDRIIADHILNLIDSGSCLQLGIGAMPNHLGKMIANSDLNNLSVHTEMLVDAFVDLYEAGKITGNKSRDKGKMVYTFALGTNRLYEFLHNNPLCMSAPVNYVNNIDVIASIDKLISINSCLQLDLYGQINSESIGHMHISGTGGQLDFVQGAFLSNGGKSFICTPSTKTTKNGRESLIVPFMPPGAIVSCPRSSAQYLVTEFGCVMLKGKSTWQRAEAIISIAHPDFRDQLIIDAEKQGIWKNSSKLL